MKTKCFSIGFAFCLLVIVCHSQDTTRYKLRLSLPLVDLPQLTDLPKHLPSMQQAMGLSNDFYELGFWGIDALGNAIIHPSKTNSKGRKWGNAVLKYGLDLAFSKWGSELPIPLGVWGHEEFHRAVLGVNDVSSRNGNWLFNRWDGTVYGLSDETLSNLKSHSLDNLLYSYVAGVQYEIALNQKTSLTDFYKARTFYKPALLLYNAWYVHDYFQTAAGSKSDSGKVLAPPHESKDPVQRDYAGNDLTAWAYDMFNPIEPYEAREAFPDGDGVNRRIGYADLSPEAQSYIKKQRNLSLLNFVNPQIFFVNRIKLNRDLSFNFFMQYAPTHFGNDIALYLPLKYKSLDLLVNLHDYSNNTGGGFGIGAGVYHYPLSDKFSSDITVNFWNQPDSFFGNKKVTGGQIQIASRYRFAKKFDAFVSLGGKTKGWTMANPYLKSNYSLQFGLNYNLPG